MESGIRTVHPPLAFELVTYLTRYSLGQKAPERPDEPVDDGKTLYEVRPPHTSAL
jgi:hypothetical protein